MRNSSAESAADGWRQPKMPDWAVLLLPPAVVACEMTHSNARHHSTVHLHACRYVLPGKSVPMPTRLRCFWCCCGCVRVAARAAGVRHQRCMQALVWPVCVTDSCCTHSLSAQNAAHEVCRVPQQHPNTGSFTTLGQLLHHACLLLYAGLCWPAPSPCSPPHLLRTISTQGADGDLVPVSLQTTLQCNILNSSTFALCQAQVEGI